MVISATPAPPAPAQPLVQLVAGAPQVQVLPPPLGLLGLLAVLVAAAVGAVGLDVAGTRPKVVVDLRLVHVGERVQLLKKLL